MTLSKERSSGAQEWHEYDLTIQVMLLSAPKRLTENFRGDSAFVDQTNCFPNRVVVFTSRTPKQRKPMKGRLDPFQL